MHFYLVPILSRNFRTFPSRHLENDYGWSLIFSCEWLQVPKDIFDKVGRTWNSWDWRRWERGLWKENEHHCLAYKKVRSERQFKFFLKQRLPETAYDIYANTDRSQRQWVYTEVFTGLALWPKKQKPMLAVQSGSGFGVGMNSVTCHQCTAWQIALVARD